MCRAECLLPLDQRQADTKQCKVEAGLKSKRRCDIQLSFTSCRTGEDPTCIEEYLPQSLFRFIIIPSAV